MFDARKKLGNFGEDLAVSFLEKHGYKIIDRNFRTQWGELDVICRRGGKFIFVEVKTRSSARFGSPEEAITKKKKETLAKMAQWYLAVKNMPEAKFSIDGVFIETEGGEEKIRHLENIVEI